MAIWRSFWKGCKRATALWPVVLLLYLVETALALVMAVPPAAQLAGVFGHSAMAPDLLGPITLDWLMEAEGNGDATFFPWPLYLLGPLLFLLLGTFLRGGTLGAIVWGAPPFRWTAFFSDCARFFWGFLFLLFFFLPGLIVVGLIFLGLNLLLVLVPSSGSTELVVTGLRAAALPFLLFLLLMAVDYARVSLVLAPERSLWRHAGRAVSFTVRRFPQVALLGLAFVLVAALFGALYPALLQIPVVAGSVFLAPLLQQLSMLLLSWQRVASLGAEVALYREGQGLPLPPRRGVNMPEGTFTG